VDLTTSRLGLARSGLPLFACNLVVGGAALALVHPPLDEHSSYYTADDKGHHHNYNHPHVYWFHAASPFHVSQWVDADKFGILFPLAGRIGLLITRSASMTLP
jgi:hypothetical protein